MSMIVLFSGILLLFSGSIPAGFDRYESVIFIPWPIVEVSHVLGAAAGIGLLISARGISCRLNTSFKLVVLLLFTGIATSLFKGLGYQEAFVLGFILILLWHTRPEFYRRTKLFDDGYPVEWISLLLIVLVITIWLGFFSFKDIPYANELRWTFDLNSNYPRFLRSIFVVLLISGSVTLINLLRPDPLPSLPEGHVLKKVLRILKSEQDPRANLVLMGDKRLRFSTSAKSFIMYQVQRKSWVVLGDPVGPAEEHSELITGFYNLCGRYGAWPVFYLIGDQNLEHYVHLGLSVDHVGDDAMLPLHEFSLHGALKTELREVYHRVKKQGVDLEIINSNQASKLIPQLREVSDDWLKSTGSTETGFAKSFFDPYYIIKFPVAVVRKNERIVAFALIWSSPNKNQMILDLTRYHHHAPKNIIDFMIIDLILHARDQGYQWVNLGTAPLSGLKRHPLEPMWKRVGIIMYCQTGVVNDVSNIRSEDARFNPTWRPKYIVTPGSQKLHRIFEDIAKLIASPRNRTTRDDTNVLERVG